MLETQPSFRFLLSCVQLVFLGTGIRTSFAGEVEVRDVASLVAALSYGQEGDLIHVAAGEYKVGASLRAKQYDLALGLANERAALKPTSVQNWRTVARAYKGLGNKSRADQANAKADSLLMN